MDKPLKVEDIISNSIALITLSTFTNGRLYHTEHGWVDVVYDELPDTDNLVALLTKRCSESTKNSVRNVLRQPRNMGSSSWYDRLQYDVEAKEWHFVAGQCYTTELRKVRSQVIGG